MRLALASLMLFAAPAALAQPAPAAAAPPPPMSAPPAPPAAPPTPQATPPAMTAPATPAVPEGAAPPGPAAPETPPGPPAPPTDPAAIAVLAVLDNVCVPLVDGGDIGKLAKANGFRKSNDAYVMKQKGYQLTVQPQGSNPDQCHVDVVHPVDPDAPAKPIVVALHDWAAVSRGWSLYRNDKNTESGQELTTRSWQHDEPGKHQALVFTTFRKPNGAPMKGSSDTSQLIYSSTKTAS